MKDILIIILIVAVIGAFVYFAIKNSKDDHDSRGPEDPDLGGY